MLIVDLAKVDGGRGRLGLLGSCRLHDPIKAFLRDGRGAFQWSAHNTFTHTPHETIQHLSFCRKELQIPDGFAPYILKQDTTPDLPQRLPDLVATCDTFIVEMSSLDRLRCGDWFFNQDYFSQTFCRGGGLGVLQWYRELGPDAPSRDSIAAAKVSLEAAGRSITPAIEEVLHETRKEELSDLAFSHGLADLTADRSVRWILCPIFSLEGLSEAQNERRLRIARLMRMAAETGGLEFYNPSDLISDVGRERALDGGGADSFHYAPDFLAIAGERFINAVDPTPMIVSADVSA